MPGVALADSGDVFLAWQGGGQDAGTDGIYALEKIMELDSEARVVVVSALSQTKLISQAIRKGAQDFIAKPFLPEQLQATLQGCLQEPVSS